MSSTYLIWILFSIMAYNAIKLAGSSSSSGYKSGYDSDLTKGYRGKSYGPGDDGKNYRGPGYSGKGLGPGDDD